MAITNLNFRKLVNKHAKEDDPKPYTLSVNGDLQAYLPEAISEENPTILITSNGNPLTENQDYIVDYTAALVTFNEMPISPVVATYYGVGSIIWAEDVIEVQEAIKTINTNAVNKNGDTLEGSLDVNGFNIANVSTINDINLWEHDHSSGNGNPIPSEGLQPNSVITSKIKDLNVTNSKLSTKVNDGVAAVSTENIQDSAVTNSEIADNTIQNSKLKDGTIENNKIKDSTIELNKLKKSDILNAIYPIGSVYISLTDTAECPIKTTLGGTWTMIEDGYYLQQKLEDKNVGDLVSAGLPNIKGRTYGEGGGTSTYPYKGAFWQPSNTTQYPRGFGSADTDNDNRQVLFDASRYNSIYSDSVSTVQTNAVQVYIWKRIA